MFGDVVDSASGSRGGRTASPSLLGTGSLGGLSGAARALALAFLARSSAMGHSTGRPSSCAAEHGSVRGDELEVRHAPTLTPTPRARVGGSSLPEGNHLKGQRHLALRRVGRRLGCASNRRAAGSRPAQTPGNLWDLAALGSARRSPTTLEHAAVLVGHPSSKCGTRKRVGSHGPAPGQSDDCPGPRGRARDRWLVFSGRGFFEQRAASLGR
jgi:hypothetical protein